jgi:hypothetical protein
MYLIMGYLWISVADQVFFCGAKARYCLEMPTEKFCKADITWLIWCSLRLINREGFYEKR